MPVAAALPFIIGGASAAGSIAQGRAAGRQAQAQANQGQDQLRLAAQRQGMQRPGMVQQDMLRGAMLGQMPTALQIGNGRANVPTSTGGVDLNALAQSPGLAALSQVMQRNALQEGLRGYAPSMTPTPQPQPNLLDKILGGVGTVGGLAGGAMYGGQNLNDLFGNPFKVKQRTGQQPGDFVPSDNIQWPTFGGK